MCIDLNKFCGNFFFGRISILSKNYPQLCKITVPIKQLFFLLISKAIHIFYYETEVLEDIAFNFLSFPYRLIKTNLLVFEIFYVGNHPSDIVLFPLYFRIDFLIIFSTMGIEFFENRLQIPSNAAGFKSNDPSESPEVD